MRIGLNEIKKRVVIAMFSDDSLMDILVLKGGNALDIIHRVISRSSFDFDFSIEHDISDLSIIRDKIERVLKNTFREVGYEVFDVTFEQKPRTFSHELEDFWGGYRAEFKIIETEEYVKISEDLEALRRNATVTGPENRRKIGIEISKFEYCRPKQATELDGYTIYVYTPAMIVCEKLRAICQQMPEYREFVKSSSQSARARDFFDIYTTTSL